MASKRLPMQLSVSVTCLPVSQRATIIDTLAIGLTTDLHCDLFGAEQGTGIAQSELVRLAKVWPRSLTIHHWSTGVSAVIENLPPSPRWRLIVELVDNPVIDATVISMAIERGWRVLVGCRPEFIDRAAAIMRTFDCEGVQLLTTSTPGRAGGYFIETAWLDIPRLQAAVGPKRVELDGGISVHAAMKAQSIGCNMVVLGTNALYFDNRLQPVERINTILRHVDGRGVE